MLFYIILTIIFLLIIYKLPWGEILHFTGMLYHKLAIEYAIWKAKRALKKINKGDLADGLKWDDNWR